MKYLLTIIAATTLISCEKSEVNNVNVPKQTIVLKGDITTNTKLTSNNEYILEGHVYVKNCSQLTIEPGTIIKSSNKSSLIIEQCSKIIANGTSTSPIVFTSNKPDGQKRRVLDSTKVKKMGWKNKISLDAGLSQIYNNFEKKYKLVRSIY